ncbi:hypothetical protein MJI12_27825, partial [Salmonella enterica subsp. enterica serovar Kentucky]|nr:hypothetical protein [Salmonella enterica subsp. enterica serovar Kentucky]
VLRTLSQLEWLINKLMSRPMTGKQRTVHYLIMVGFYQLLYTRLIMQPLWLADINAVDTTVVTFPHHPLQALAQLRDIYLLGWC